jgi:ABC-type branched-subunit amino acid transport system ATPase component
MGTISGAIVGSIVVVSLPFLLTKLTASLPAAGIGSWFTKNIFYINNGLYGILVLVVLLYLPEGLVPALGKLSRWVLARATRPARPQPGRAAAAPRPAATESAEERARQEERAERPALLDVSHLNVTYQTGARAVSDLNLRVEPHAIVAVLGRNGAGKTSALRAVSGFLVAEQVKLGGRILYDGRNVLGGSPTKTAALGLVLVPERDKIFPSLTVLEHLKLAGSSRVDEVIARPYFRRLKDRMNQPAGLLSGGERQLLALATASLLEPRLLMVDEFTLGLAPVMIQEVARVIRGLRDDGMTILLVEQNAAAALELADWVYLMEGGEVVAEGTPADMADRVTMTAQVAR